MHIPLVVVLCVIWILTLGLLSFPDPQGTDLFPLMVCAEAIVEGHSPYEQWVSHKIQNEWEVARAGTRVAAVCAYPLPFYLLIVPLLALPIRARVVGWWILSLSMIAVCSQTRREKGGAPWEGMVLAIAYYPIFHAIILKTSTVGVAALLGMIVVREAAGKSAPFWAVLPAILKPQVGLLPALFTMRRWDIRKVISLVGVFALSVVVYPLWPLDWLTTISLYAERAVSHSLLPPALLLVVVPLTCILVWHLGLIAVAIVLQVFVWPTNDLYCVIPLIYPLLLMPFAISFPACAVSWLLPVLFEYPNSLEGVLSLTIVPFLIACYLSRRGKKGMVHKRRI